MSSFTVDHDAVAASLMAQLRRTDVEPFLVQLAKMLICPPTVEAIQAWSSAHPDRWATAVSVLTKLGGFTEKRELAIGIKLDLSRLPDSRLADRLKAGFAWLSRPDLEIEDQ